IRSHHPGPSNKLSFDSVQTTIGNELVAAYREGTFDQCLMVFNTFKSAMTQELTWQSLMPAAVEEESGASLEKKESIEGGYIFEPSDDEILDSLLPRNITVQLYKAFVESDASEHGARMTAMDNAVRNAGDMIRRLQILFNRTRQAAITTELMEIIGGAESLKG
ncbi:MAG: F0F1 ATP synthase subunit gamma, partial [Magnetococcales bacterium]|nr:F0F1 ATP synthase subunit gamma [Magnetococcales bacterium]